MNLVNSPGQDETDTSIPYMVDADGEIRWILDWEKSDEHRYIGIGCGLIRMQNGHYMTGDGNHHRMVEVDMMGNTIHNWDMLERGYTMHHAISQDKQGNILATVSKTSAKIAKEKITAGAIGTPYLVKSTGIDPEAVVEGAIRYSGTSGGIFLDSAIHDMDLMRWFLGSEAAEVYAMGCTFKHPAFQDAGDDETGVAVYKFKNGAMGMVHVGRTAPYGYHIETEIVGTEGTIRISAVPEKNRAMVYDVNGARTECVESFPERFAEAYLTEMEEFIRCVREGRKPDTGVADGIYATRVGYATTEAWKTEKIVKI